MSTSDYDYSAYAGTGHNSKDFPEITKLAEAQHAAQVKVENLGNLLHEAKEELRDIAERKLPAKMDELGLSEYKTTSGVFVQVKEKIRASLAVENRPKGFAWLEENGFGGMIKSSVVVGFKRDQLPEANELVDSLRSEGKLANLERKVEPATLTAFVKEQLMLGKDIPLEVFGVFRQRESIVEL